MVNKSHVITKTRLILDVVTMHSGALRRSLSAPAEEALLSRDVKQLPEKLDVVCGTARGVLLVKRARITYQGVHRLFPSF